MTLQPADEGNEGDAAWLLSPGERNLLIALFSRPPEPRDTPRLSRASADLEAQGLEDLADELARHRQALRSRMTAILDAATPVEAGPQTDGPGWILRLTPDDRETFLQSLNEIRLGAWERLGRPDPPEMPPGLSPDAPELFHWATLEIASRFQGRLLSGIFPE